jgi:hypothetical protein
MMMEVSVLGDLEGEEGHGKRERKVCCDEDEYVTGLDDLN